MSVIVGIVIVVAALAACHRWEVDTRPVGEPAPESTGDDSAPTEYDDPDHDTTDDDSDDGDPVDVPSTAADNPDVAERTADPAEVESAGYPWWDERSCWGCDKSCKRSKFHPYAGTNIGAELRGASAARARVAADEPYSAGLVSTSKRTAPPDTRRSTSVDALWDDSCAACGRWVRRVASGLEPVPGSIVAVEPGAVECPF